MGIGHYNREGKPISLMEWGRLFEDPDYKRVKLTIGAGRRVSTIWMGLDHSFEEGADPLIFETMIFKDVEGADRNDEIDVQRYSTEEQALAGHEEMVQQHVYILDRFVRELRKADEAVDAPGDAGAPEAAG